MSFRHREAGNESSDGFSVRASVSKSHIYAFERVVCVCQIEEVINDFVQPTSNAQSTSSRRNNDVRQDLIARRAVHQAEMKRLDEEIRVIEDLRRQQIQSIQDITQQIGALDERVASGPAIIQNYFDEFEWSGRLREQMRKVFGIENFRLAQEGYAIFTTTVTARSEYRKHSVCNANMDGRDIICIMPTGKWDIVPFPFRAVSIYGSLLTQGPGNHLRISYLRR
jgi:ATP-dependent DNA helicase Q1